MEQYQYTIFKTQWGWFGLLGSERGLVRTCLPVAHKEAVQCRLLSDAPTALWSKRAFSVLKDEIIDYYGGLPVDFSNVEVQLEGFSGFQQHALKTLQTVTHGITISYGQLARLAGNPKAARAIGTAMASNPLPLIIPCHRVIKSDGTLGMFSAPGGIETKKRMLDLEKSCLDL